jgi:hypothetical protein
MKDDNATIEAMQRYGGSFVKALGQAAAHADIFNLKKIKCAFPEYWKEYEKMGEKDSEGK